VEPLFSAIEFVRVNSATAGCVLFLRHNRMEHLVIDHVLEKPGRNKWGIKKRMNTDDPVLFLNGPEDKIFLRRQPSFAPPGDGIAA
jgi:hypothetical protein